MEQSESDSVGVPFLPPMTPAPRKYKKGFRFVVIPMSIVHRSSVTGCRLTDDSLYSPGLTVLVYTDDSLHIVKPVNILYASRLPERVTVAMGRASNVLRGHTAQGAGPVSLLRLQRHRAAGMPVYAPCIRSCHQSEPWTNAQASQDLAREHTTEGLRAKYDCTISAVRAMPVSDTCRSVWLREAMPAWCDRAQPKYHCHSTQWHRRRMSMGVFFHKETLMEIFRLQEPPANEAPTV